MRNFTHSRFLKTPLFFRGKWFYLKCAIFSCFFWFCGTSILIAQTFSATGLPAGIPDGGVISKTITVSGLSGTVADANEVQVSFAIRHKWAGDIKIGIIPPGGSEITIVNTIGTQCYSNSDFVSANVITISQNATNQLPSQNNITIPGGTFLPSSCNTKPVGTLASLVGATRNGDWTIKVYDVETIEAGQLHSASITIGNSQCDPPKFTAPTVVKSKCDSPTGIIIVNTTVAEGLEYTINDWASWQSSATFEGLAAGNYTLKVRLQDNKSCEATYENNPVVVSNYPPPTVSASITSICVGSTITLSPTSGGAWVSSDNSKATVSNAGVVTGISAGSVTFTFTETATGCSATTSSVMVNSLPIVSTPTETVCAGSTITLSPTNGGTWVSSDNSKATVSNAGVVTGVSAGSVAFTFTETAMGCSVTTSSVTVKPLPTATITGDATVCKGSLSHTITFIGASGTAPYTFTYKLNGGNEFQITTENGTNVASIDVLTTAVGTLEYSLVSVKEGSPNACNQTQTGSAVVTIQGKPTIVLNTLQQTLNEGNTQVFCDTDANPVNGLQFTVSGLCVVGNPVWRVQVGGGSWSEWSATAPVSQLSNNQPHRYQAACDVSCPVTYTSPIELTINYRASVPQNVSLLVDGVTVAAGETKEVCSLTNSPITFTANCGSGEVTFYSVDGGEYSAGAPLGLVDNQFHNYRVRCRKSDGTSSCVESESGVMRLKLVGIPAAPTVSLSPTTSCTPASIFSGQSSCGSLRTVWYNATTNVALSSLPSTVPSETTSYYARCQTENGCVSEKSNVVTFTVTPVNVAPIVTVSQDVVCTGTTVTVLANCPVGSTTSWNTGVSTPSFEVAFSNITKQSYWAKCVFEGGCQSAESNRKEVYWQAFVVSLINIGESKSGIKSNDRAAWSSQFITADGGPELDQSTQQSPTLYYVENVNKMAPRYWTIHADACGLGTTGSLTFDMLATPEMGVIRSFNTHENNAPYFMYANREGWTELYAQNHPAYGFYEDNGSGGNVYDAGLPKGLYKLSIRYWDMKGWGSIYPSTRKPQGNVLAYQEYWFRIQSKDGVGVGAAREMANGQEAKGKGQGSDNGKQLTDKGVFATVLPNPVTNILRLKVQDSKGQMVQTSLTDAVGREVLSRHFRPETNTHQEEFGVSELPTGIYFLRVKSEAFQSTLKVVKL
ncbi:T9SS type A sorting domain-containing protein [Runella sp. SP2]|uniref:T9SS type A sorting domain-containing protein n=1 Tax=Runella sp. SP2 TaxID=2268026 RepID=UPI000F07AB14|nr:T9SS type A sorting domain-containing protein [Runella sp. SP2]AYQ33353.1 T9SS C-terminal target domain-containing protein [Runella sp. SP2]